MPEALGVLRVLPLLIFMAACAPGPPRPATLDTANDTCRHCRMAVSDRHFAAQIVAPGEEPLFFDDIGCLRDYAAAHAELLDDAVVFVADHRTAEWVEGRSAVYTRTRVATPMASGLMAHRDASSRDQDPSALGGTDLPASEILGERPR